MIVPVLKYLYYKLLSKFRTPFPIRENSVLLIEFKSFHGETLPGYIKYLLDLGYNVDVVLHKSKTTDIGYRNDHGLFSCFNANSKVKIISLPTHDINLLTHSSILSNYKHIVVNTFDDKIERRFFCFSTLSQLKPICVVHNPDIIDNHIKTTKMVSLVKMISVNQNSPIIVNPHYFGEFTKKSKKGNAEGITIFVALNSGGSRRNLNLLFNACDNLYKKGIYNFLIKIIGKGVHIPECYHNNIHDFGFLDFQPMYKEINTSDFFMALIDQENTEYTNKASGTYQISYGFLKPLVLHRQFSGVAGFSGKDSVLYNTNNDLADSMETCIKMSNDDYCNMVDALEKSQKDLYVMSLDNLRKAFNTAVN